MNALPAPHEARQNPEAISCFRYLLDFSDIPVAIYDVKSGCILDANEAARQLMQHDCAGQINQNGAKVIDAGALPIPPGADPLLAIAEFEGHFQLDIENARGIAQTLDIHTRKVEEPGNAYMIIICHDITALADAHLVDNERGRLTAEQSGNAFAEAACQAIEVLGEVFNVDIVLDRILDSVAGVIQADTYNIILIENEFGRIVRSKGYEKIGVNKENLEASHVPVFEYDNFKRMIRTGEPVITNNTRTDTTWLSSDTTRQPRSYIGAAIRINGETVGFINAGSLKPGQFNANDARRLSLFAGYVAIALRNARSYQQTSEYAANLEQRVANRTRALELRTKWAEAMLNSTTDGIIILDHKQTYIQTNQVARQLFQKTLSHDDARKLRSSVSQVARQNLPAETFVELNGIDLELKASAVEDENEPAIIVTIHDITHLRTVNRMKSQFVSDISHELRTPIATIGLYVNLIRNSVNKEGQEYLSALNTEVASLTHLVESILQVSRFETDRTILDPQPVNLNILCTSTANGFEPVAAAKGLELRLELDRKPVIATVDTSAFKYALNNIVENAITYTDSGHVTIKTGIEESGDRFWAVITISDSGIGILTSDIRHIFDKFYRGETARQRQISGGGMGLALAQIITQQHGGHITVTSETGRGSEFRLWLPSNGPAT